MTKNIKIGIITDEIFYRGHVPPYPKPSFLSHENPLRIRRIMDYFDSINLFQVKNIKKIIPIQINKNDLKLAHSDYHIEIIEWMSKKGGSILNEEVFIDIDTFQIAKRAVAGAISTLSSVINDEVNVSFGLIRPPGHHASREQAFGFCIFNNIANAILYLRKKLNYDKKIAIIDIDDHYGDGLAKFFYEDPNVLYCSIHEYNFSEPEPGFLDEIGAKEGKGFNINFPVPEGIDDKIFLYVIDFFEKIINEFNPGLIIVAIGFDGYFDDPVGNMFLTSQGYYSFTKKILRLSNRIKDCKLAFILEGGYSLIGLPYCVHAVLKALFNQYYDKLEFERFLSIDESLFQTIKKIENRLKNLLAFKWNF
ncbi:MAG: histone deacetylase family protein [Promethearchaeota archaeon]